jgi:23S rRNA pseudouridine2457 synthase
LKTRFTYLLFYKPYNVLSRFTKDLPQQSSLSDFLKVGSDVYPVGRLDADSEGLLLLTNDTYLTAKVLEPSSEKSKTYLVQVDGQIHDEAIQQLEKGVSITVDHKKYTTKPCKAVILKSEPVLPPRNPPVRFRKNIPTSWVSITIQEGKNRQVRKMCAATGFPVLRLVRTKIAGLSAENLKPGKFITVDAEKIYQALHISFPETATKRHSDTPVIAPSSKKSNYKSFKKKRN